MDAGDRMPVIMQERIVDHGANSFLYQSSQKLVDKLPQLLESPSTFRPAVTLQ
jgi:hypothetical protein